MQGGHAFTEARRSAVASAKELLCFVRGNMVPRRRELRNLWLLVVRFRQVSYEPRDNFISYLGVACGNVIPIKFAQMRFGARFAHTKFRLLRVGFGVVWDGVLYACCASVWVGWRRIGGRGLSENRF